jgi:hypothetical protein
LPGATTSSNGVFPTIFPFTHICASTGVARKRIFPASLPAVASSDFRLVSSAGGPADATRCGEDDAAEEAEDEAPDPVPGNLGMVGGFMELATLAETELAPAVSATACPWMVLADAKQRRANAAA